MSRKKVLFVDDDQFVLDGLKRTLRAMRGQWEMSFASSGKMALEIMAEQPVDVIVTDMRMPVMTGSELLQETMRKYPKTARVVLSGHSDINVVMQAVLPAHQYLAKPCSSEKIRDAIEKVLKVRSFIQDESVQSIVSRISSLPAVPDIYQRVLDELSKTEPSLRKIGEIIAKEVGMSAKLLKLVNSCFFGFYRPITSPEQAVNLLGVNVLKALILSVHVFSVYDFSRVLGFSLNRLWNHCLTTARLAEEVGKMEGLSGKDADACFVSGLFHDLGKLVLASQLPEEYNTVLEKVRHEKKPVHEAEQEVMGAGHAGVGAYLIGLWGMPDPVVEAIAFHHGPFISSHSFQPLTAVHVANILEHRHFIINKDYLVPDFDQDYLDRIGLSDRIPVWDELVRNKGSSAEEPGE